MQLIRRVRMLFAAFACAILAIEPMRGASGEEDAASYPSKPIRIIVGFAAGGGNDQLKAVAYTPDGRSGEEFRQLIDADIQAYSDVVKAASLKFD
jgi:tripartite-type tricarboxylate transporter receptor subunit TctC